MNSKEVLQVGIERLAHESSRTHAEALDEHDPLRHLRHEFIIPTKEDLKSKKLDRPCMFT